MNEARGEVEKRRGDKGKSSDYFPKNYCMADNDLENNFLVRPKVKTGIDVGPRFTTSHHFLCSKAGIFFSAAKQVFFLYSKAGIFFSAAKQVFFLCSKAGVFFSAAKQVN
jgi:hypothetical protein